MSMVGVESVGSGLRAPEGVPQECPQADEGAGLERLAEPGRAERWIGVQRRHNTRSRERRCGCGKLLHVNVLRLVNPTVFDGAGSAMGHRARARASSVAG